MCACDLCTVLTPLMLDSGVPLFLLFCPLMQSPSWCTNLQRLCASLLTSSFPFSFPFAVVCPEKEVEFQRAPNGEPCLPTHPAHSMLLVPACQPCRPILPCACASLILTACLCCVDQCGLSCQAGPLPKVTEWPYKWASEGCCGGWVASNSLMHRVKPVGVFGKDSLLPSLKR